MRRVGEQAALLIIDVDGFKNVNDTHGHRAGDQLLKDVASALTRRLCETDVIARIGDDEFAVLLPHADSSRAAAVGGDLCRVISECQIDAGNGSELHMSA